MGPSVPRSEGRNRDRLGTVRRAHDRTQRCHDDVLVDADTPDHFTGDLTLHIGGSLRIAASRQGVFAVVEDADLGPGLTHPVDEGIHRTVALTAEGTLLATHD